MDTLSNGDIFLHGVEMKGQTPAASVEQFTPGYEPSQRTNRKPWRPKVEPRVGVMCPSCHQSRMLTYSIEKCNHDDDIFNMCLVFGFNEKDLFMLDTWQIFKPASVSENYGNAGPTMDWTPTEADKLLLLEFLKTPDIIINGLGDAKILTLSDVASEWAPDKNAKCPICGEVHTIQEWINEYAVPTAGFHDICKICGGEMAIDCKNGFMGAADSQPMKCEVCNYEDSRNLKQET